MDTNERDKRILADILKKVDSMSIEELEAGISSSYFNVLKPSHGSPLEASGKSVEDVMDSCRLEDFIVSQSTPNDKRDYEILSDILKKVDTMPFEELNAMGSGDFDILKPSGGVFKGGALFIEDVVDDYPY